MIDEFLMKITQVISVSLLNKFYGDKSSIFHCNWAIPVHLLQEILAEVFKTITGSMQ